MTRNKSMPPALQSPVNFGGSPGFLISVFAVLSLCIIGLGWLFYTQREKAIKREAQAELSTIADLKAGQIINWRNERLTDAEMIRCDPFVSLLLEKHFRSVRDAASKTELSKWLSQLVIAGHYRSVTLFDARGGKILSFPDTFAMAIAPGIRPLFDSSLSLHRIMLSDLHRDGTGPNDLHFDLIVPVYPRAGKDTASIGAVDLDIDPKNFLFPIIQSWPLPSPTAEVLLVRKEGDSVIFLNRLRHKRHAALTLRLPLDDTALPASRAIAGFRGAMEGRDYRGVPVLAVARPIPGTPWFMIAKLDKSEAFADTQTLFVRAMVAVILLIMLIGVVTALVQRNRSSKAYKRLYLAEKETSELAASLAAEKERLLVTLRSIGDGVITTDTKGEIALMNGVAEQLTGWVVTEAAGRPLFEVFHIINEQTRAKCENPVEKVLKNGTVVGLANHTALIARDGTEHAIADSGAPIRDAQGNILGVVLVFRDVSEWKQAEELLRESEARLRALTDAAFEGVCLSEQGLIIDINDQLTRMFGFTREEVIGKPIRDFVASSDREKVIPTMQRQTPGAIELHAVRKGGGEFPVEIRGRTMQTGGRNLRVTTILDISERYMAEQALKESEEKFRRIFEQSSLGKALSDKNNVFVAVNPAFCAMLGYTEQELLKLTFKDITHPDHLTGDAVAVGQLIRGEIPVYKTEKRYVKKSGETLYGSLTLSSLRDDRGTHQYSLVILEDITEKKRAEDALVAEKERLAVTLRSIGDAVIATDVDGRVSLMNKVAEQLTGVPFAEARGRPLSGVFDIINEDTRQPFESPVEKVLSSGLVVGLANHTVLISKDGREIPIADSGAPIRDKDSVVIGVVLVFRDISEKLKADLALRNTQKLESLGVLAGGIAHDFNNLLSGLFGYLDLAKSSVKKNDKAADYLDKAFSVFGRAKDLTGQLLTFSKGGAPSRKPHSLSPLIRDAVHFALSGSSVRATFDLADDLWLCDVDENQISQVLDNIVINARDAMPMGGEVAITAENVPADGEIPLELAAGNYVRVSICDQGVGIAKEHLSRIFDPFFTTKQKGSGLGLATSYSIVKRHEGALEAQSGPGMGATFTIYLPASRKAAVPAHVAEQRNSFKGSGRVLVMDDEDVIRDVAQSMLGNMGYAVTVASHGQEAIDEFQSAAQSGKPFDVVILDLTVPGGMGGTATKDQLRKLAPTVKIVASSGYSDDPVIARPRDFAFDASIRKPYNLAELEDVMRAMMSR